jgi:hypothetical protein
MPYTKSDINGAEVLLGQLECQGVDRFRCNELYKSSQRARPPYGIHQISAVRFLIGFS